MLEASALYVIRGQSLVSIWTDGVEARLLKSETKALLEALEKLHAVPLEAITKLRFSELELTAWRSYLELRFIGEPKSPPYMLSYDQLPALIRLFQLCVDIRGLTRLGG